MNLLDGQTCTTIRFTVPAVPVAQPRPRAVKFGDRARMHEVTHIKGSDGRRRPHPINAFRATVAQCAADAYCGEPLGGPVCARITFVMPRPGRMIWKTRPMLREQHDCKPDIENMAKAVLDSLTAKIWRDDAQVSALVLSKVYAAGDEQPHVEIEIQPLT